MASLITRRRLLVGGAALAAASLAGGLASFLHLPPSSPGYKVLSEREQLQVSALGQALFPTGNPLGPSFLEIDGVARVDALLDDGLHARSVKPLRYTLGALDWGARLSLGTPLHLLDPAEALTLLQAWSTHEVILRRAAVDGVKSVLAMAYFDNARVLERLEFTPGCYA
ncbi:MAG: hypothetical protein VX899_15220 [Myxococcota bacterium]|nr:hypothetical protein [Myxococcota bacterium]